MTVVVCLWGKRHLAMEHGYDLSRHVKTPRSRSGEGKVEEEGGGGGGCELRGRGVSHCSAMSRGVIVMLCLAPG